ncbi:Spermatogenesis- and oogenesis-specific basic helix-loop-helix-containing protein 1 [Cricetulus griseus]|uniref:Spermatogenesis-and oogenesis-specific basic helix-loop-helix-containing protein 1 n=1 Tax=Cricetulus griseus TaxID=10029 RepID=G3ID52_CRIGR|nr:Spermatogenesis- and oogenesis-specific basic helix-loop-helix-containing protein 1 [Cricetulus griseus]
MAFSGHEQTTEDYGVCSFTGCRTPQPETPDSLRPRTGPVAPADSCLRRNVVSERERRRRISLSCERLRALLPQFDGRREDMASVLEMAVCFLQLAHSMAPGWEQLSVPQSPQEMWHVWQGDVLQVSLADQITDRKPDSGIAKAAAARYTPGAGSDVVDGAPFLLTTNPDWWLGSVEGREGPVLATSSPMDGAEPSFMGDPEPSSQELHAGPLELWGLDFGSPGLALKDEADSIFPDFFPC